MAYTIVIDPGTVDSPDVPAYRPHVHGRLDPPALIPLQMQEVDLHVYITIACTEVTLHARWWVHCITRSPIKQHLLYTAFFPLPILGACHRLFE
jgi:hypothetical protein